MINKYIFDSKKPWKNILIFWCIHWNEICWELASLEVIKMIEEKQINLKSGKITFVPTANPKAREIMQRYVDENLNRVFKEHKNPQTNEQKLANILTKLVKENDILLDIHSTHSDDEPFVFLDYNDEENNKLAKACLVENILVGWPEIYEKSDASDTCFYAKNNNKVWVTLECWNHYKKESIEVAKKAILNVLATYWNIDFDVKNINNFNNVLVQKYFIKEKNWKLQQNFNHLDKIKSWEIIANYEDETNIKMPYDWYILLPFLEANIWDEWFYIGKNI